MAKKTHLYVWFWILLFIYILSAERFFKYTLLVWNLAKIFSSTVNISFANVANAAEFLLATSEVYSPMANVAIFSANTDWNIQIRIIHV
jgi:hypothetical protein